MQKGPRPWALSIRSQGGQFHPFGCLRVESTGSHPVFSASSLRSAARTVVWETCNSAPKRTTPGNLPPLPGSQPLAQMGGGLIGEREAGIHGAHELLYKMRQFF
jgi:hypothetical protein